MLIHELILDRLDGRADRTALIRGDESLTYADLSSAIQTTAGALRSVGVRRNDRIGIYLNKRFESVISFFAASSAGAIFVPINPVLKAKQVGHILRDCNVSVLITSDQNHHALSDELRHCKDLQTIIIAGDCASPETPAGDFRVLSWTGLLDLTGKQPARHRCIDNDIASILYTSGSTGKPKGVVLSHRNMVAGATSVSSYIGNNSDDRILAVLPLSFDAGFSQLTTGFSSGAAVVLLDYLLPRDVLKTADEKKVTGITGVPPLWNQLIGLQWPKSLRETLRYVANTGGAMPTPTLARIREKLPKTKVFLMYGLTESFRSTYLPPEEVENRPTSIGKAIPNAEILVVRPDGTRCDPGEAGELVHRGALVSLGYWNDAVKTKQRFKPLPGQYAELTFPEMTVWSGDMVFADEDGYLYFVGRNDDMIKSSGYRISPSEVEEVIYQTGLVDECAAIGVPHPVLGQAVVTAVTGPVQDNDTEELIMKECRQVLPNYMVPRAIRWEKTMPKNPNGKIDRRSLAEKLQTMFAEDQ